MMARLLALLGVLFTLPASAQVLYPPFLTSVDGSYTWSLGDLADQSARLTGAVLWDDGSWADPYDTEAELTALGWTTVNLASSSCTDNFSSGNPQTSGSADGRCDSAPTTYNIDCADGGSGTGGDELGIRATFADNCSSFNCSNKIFKFASGSCHIDMLAGSGNTGDQVGGLPLRYSNFAIVGRGMNTSYIDCNDAGGASTPLAHCMGTSWVFGLWGNDDTAESGSTIDVSGSIAVGATSVTLVSSCASFTVGERVIFKGTSADGENLQSLNEVVSCSTNTLTLLNPVRYAIPATVTATQTEVYQTTNTFFLDFTVAYPHVPDGQNRDLPSIAGYSISLNHPTNALVKGVRIGPYQATAIGTIAHINLSVEDSEIGPGQFGKRRGTNGRVFYWGGSGRAGPVSVSNNVFTDAAKRFIEASQMSSNGSWYGFNYMTDMAATAPSETGWHWNAVGNPQGLAHSTACGIGTPDACNPTYERTAYFGHDGNTSNSKPGYMLVESNDLGGHMFFQGTSGDSNRYTTIFRNRQNRETLCGGSVDGTGWCGTPFGYDSGTYDVPYWNWIANRAVEWASDSSHQTNVLGRWNVAEEASGARSLTATGFSWPTSSTYKNYVDTGPHDDYATTNIPPSLALKTGTPPSWWCTESGTWDGTWSFGYGDGGDNGGTPRKLPAQIQYEIREGLGGTCTPPTP